MRPLMMYEPHGGALWLFFRLLFWFFIALGIILLIVWLIRQSRRHKQFHRLKMRYAQGKISEDEYERMDKTSPGADNSVGNHLLIIAVILIGLGLLGIFAAP